MLVFVLLCIVLSFLFCNHLEEEERASYFAFIVLQMSCYCICFVTLTHGAVGWSAVCDCGIFLSNSLAFFIQV